MRPPSYTQVQFPCETPGTQDNQREAEPLVGEENVLVPRVDPSLRGPDRGRSFLVWVEGQAPHGDSLPGMCGSRWEHVQAGESSPDLPAPISWISTMNPHRQLGWGLADLG